MSRQGAVAKRGRAVWCWYDLQPPVAAAGSHTHLRRILKRHSDGDSRCRENRRCHLPSPASPHSNYILPLHILSWCLAGAYGPCLSYFSTTETQNGLSHLSATAKLPAFGILMIHLLLLLLYTRKHPPHSWWSIFVSRIGRGSQNYLSTNQK